MGTSRTLRDLSSLQIMILHTSCPSSCATTCEQFLLPHLLVTSARVTSLQYVLMHAWSPVVWTAGSATGDLLHPRV